MGRSWAKVASFALTGVVVAAAAPAIANPYDISLRGLGRPKSNDLTDPAVERYRMLATELTFALAPRPLQPAETLGVSGFEFSLVSTTTNISEKAAHWQGQPGAPIMEGALRGRNVPGALWTPTVHIRKGLPMSTELGLHGTYLAFSEMLLFGAELKIAIYESYMRWIPAVAARLAFGRLVGSSEIDIVTGEADGLLSLPFGVAGLAQITPYFGAGVLFAHVNSYVLDETPYLVTEASDQKGGPDGSLYTFPTLQWNKNRLTRIVVGVRASVAFLEIMYELDLGLVSFANKTLTSHSIKFGFDV